MGAGRFFIERRDRRVDQIAIESEGLTIGRSPGNELVLNHRAIELTHAGIRLIEDKYWVFNLSTANGVVLNRGVVDRSALADGDVLQLGPYLLRFSPSNEGLNITIEVGAGWQLAESPGPGRQSSSLVNPSRPATGPQFDEAALDVFWDKRRRESGKISEQTILHPRGRGKLGKALVSWAPTLDLRSPWRRSYFVWGAIAVAAASAVALAVYREAFSPGEIARVHQAPRASTLGIAQRGASGACSSCHSLTASIETRCFDCHRTAMFRPAVSQAHQEMGMSCASCHAEHQGQERLTRTDVCLDCHTDRKPTREGNKAGQILGVPHSGSTGYPVVDAQWKWKGLAAEDWQLRGLPDYLAQRPPADQFHAIHRAVVVTSAARSRMDCRDCHNNLQPSKEPRARALENSCASCHTLKGSGPPAAAHCVSCHPPHGTSRGMRALLAAAKDDFRTLAAQAQVRPTTKPVKTVAVQPANRIGGLPWYGWLGFAAIPIVACAIGLVSISSRRRSSFARAQTEPRRSTTLVRSRDDAPSYPHPMINPELCIGCHACVEACPHDVLAIVNGVATPVALDQCMEDTSCMAECPTSPKACVVVNTAKVIPARKIPQRNQAFLTNIPGIYLIGDVSGVPLIKNAINEGAQVMQFVIEDLQADSFACEGMDYDVAIIGIGPAGFSAAAVARQCGLNYIAIEQSRLASTLRGYPAGKYVFFKPETTSVKGPIPLAGIGGRKEELLESWAPIANSLGIREEERCTKIEPVAGGFEIRTLTSSGPKEYRARRVILAIGNSGSPMKLGVSGEDLQTGGQSKVQYSLSDPSLYGGKKCIVVGAGNSAVEAAVDLVGFERRGDGFAFTRTNEVTLVVRSDFKGDLKLGNKMNIYDCMDTGKIKVLFRTTVKEITSEEVVLADARSGEERMRTASDFIFALIGRERPTKFLENLGIKIG